jgi:hypothetical protein
MSSRSVKHSARHMPPNSIAAAMSTLPPAACSACCAASRGKPSSISLASAASPPPGAAAGAAAGAAGAGAAAAGAGAPLPLVPPAWPLLFLAASVAWGVGQGQWDGRGPGQATRQGHRLVLASPHAAPQLASPPPTNPSRTSSIACLKSLGISCSGRKGRSAAQEPKCSTLRARSMVQLGGGVEGRGGACERE